MGWGRFRFDLTAETTTMDTYGAVQKSKMYLPKSISSDDETEERTQKTIKVNIVVIE